MLAQVEIRSPEQITTGWINDLLRGNGFEGGVESFQIAPIGSGQLAESRRLSLSYADGDGQAGPASIVGKFPSTDAVSRETCRTLNLYRNEVLFYKELSAHAGIFVPPLLAADVDPETHDFVLIFGDMSFCRAGNQLDGMSVDEGRWALREAARLHASHWNDNALMKRPWISVPQTAQDFYTTELVEQAWVQFRSLFSERIEPEIQEVCERFVKAHRMWNVPLDTPRCLTHNDFRPDNMLIDDAAGRIATVDWQTVNMLSSGMDVAYFIGGSMFTDDRRAHEQDLLNFYYDELTGNGVRYYSFDQFFRDYRHYSFAGMAVALAAIVLVKRTPRGDDMLLTMLERHARHVLDLNALQLLDG